jgi:hypothetical protein
VSTHPSRSKVIDSLESFGIRGSTVYLLDLIPLIEIAWADGEIQRMELLLLRDFLKSHVERINRKAGFAVLDYRTACDFLTGFLKKRPDPALLRALRGLVVPCRLGHAGPESRREKLTLLKFCMDIAAIAVTHYPYGHHERFDESEKRAFLEILDTLDISPERSMDDVSS